MKKIKDQSGIIKRFSSKGIFPYQFAFTLLVPLRNIFLSPKQLIKRLELEDHQKVLEVGPGPGYFSIPVAKVLINGRLVIADIQQEMLDYAKKRIEKKELKNIEYYLCDGNTFRFPNHAFDRIFMVTVIGEVENKKTYMDEFLRMLKPGGILSISEAAGDPDKMTREELQELAVTSGFEFYGIYGNRRNYTINFKKIRISE